MKKKGKRKEVMSIPQKEWGIWFAEHILSGLALEFYHQYKKWPSTLDLNSICIKECSDGSGLLSVGMK